MSSGLQLFPIYLVGSFPKPSYFSVPSWFYSKGCGYNATDYNKYLKDETKVKKDELMLSKAFNEIIQCQTRLGCDIITNGEINQEHYIYYFCRYCLNGFDFNNMKQITARNNCTKMTVPQITNKVSLNPDSLNLIGDLWYKLQQHSTKPIKIAIPGPMTIADSTFNAYYKNKNDLLSDLSFCINKYLIHSTNNYNIKYIQIDEPLFSRKPETAKNIGFKFIKTCFENVLKNKNGEDIYKTIHICCGYTDGLNKYDYMKADNNAYVQLAQYGIDAYLHDECGVDGISIEDAHSRVPINFFKLINKLDIILGSIRVCETIIYDKEEIINRVNYIIKYGKVKANKILLSPDCGLAMLPIEIVKKKLTALNEARNLLRVQYRSLSKL